MSAGLMSSPKPAAPRPVAADFGLNANDWRAMEELPACCAGTRKQIAVDIDETVHGGKKVAELLRGGAPVAPTPVAPVATQAPARGAWSDLLARLPRPHSSVQMTALTLWTAIPGLLFSVQNARQARLVGDLLGRLLAQVDARRDPRATDETNANLRAYRDTIAHSIGMQRFIRVFAGYLAGFSSVLVMASLFAPVLEPVALCVLGAYCASFALRYALWDAPRQFDALPPATSGSALAQQGRALAEQVRRSRQALFFDTSAFFSLYGVGAGLLAFGSGGSSIALTAVGMGALFVGMSAVTYLNNFPIKDTFGKNRDPFVERERLGGVQDIYAAIGRRQAERACLLEADGALAEVAAAHATLADRALTACEWLVIGGTLATLGLFPKPLHWVQHIVRDRQQRALREDARTPPILHALAGRLAALGSDAAAPANAEAAASPVAAAPPLASALATLQRTLSEPLLDFAGHADAAPAEPDNHAGHAHGHAHGPDCEHSHGHAPDWTHKIHQLGALHALRFGLPGEKDYQVGALVDHVQARVRLSRHAPASL